MFEHELLGRDVEIGGGLGALYNQHIGTFYYDGDDDGANKKAAYVIRKPL